MRKGPREPRIYELQRMKYGLLHLPVDSKDALQLEKSGDVAKPSFVFPTGFWCLSPAMRFVHMMQSQSREMRGTISTRKLTLIAILTATASILFLFESFLPQPLPWVKPGLANAVTLLAVYLLDLPAALLIVLLRVALGHLILGTLFGPSMFLSLGGGMAAAIVMAGVHRFLPHLFSPVGVSVLGALTHNLLQLALVALLVVHSNRVWTLLPWMVVPAVFAGIIIGVVAWLLLQRVPAHSLAKN
ncbi:MAG TPA: Gx transporter family protein [bacterium]|nr:Gx transporter family protein [bacterium]